MTTTATTQPSTRPSTSRPASALRSLPASPSLGLLLLRLALGAVLIAHGAQKAFVFGFAGTADAFGQMGVPLAEVAAPVVTIVELAGGIAIVVGIATRVAALLVAIDMVVAAILVHAPFGIFVEDGGMELVLVLGGAALALVAAGPGRCSLDRLLAAGH